MPGRFSAVRGAALLIVVSLGANAPAAAQETLFTFEGDVTLKSDYDFRGISRSDKGLALQGGFDLVHVSGLYLGSFLSTMDDPFGHDVEFESHIGYGVSSGAYDLDFRVAWDSFHGDGDTQGYLEVQGAISRDFGLAYVTGGLSFTPGNREYGLGRSAYFFSEAEFPLPLPNLPPVSLALHMGYENFEGSFDKWDWNAAIFTEVANFEVGLGYYDTNLDNFRGADARFIFSIRKYF
jgi:uncharacterized protein (TIGR02001 family)